MYNCYSFFGENKDLIFKPSSSELLFTDLQHIIAMQNDNIDFAEEVNTSLLTKVTDIEKKLFSELFFGNYGYNIAIYKLRDLKENGVLIFNSKAIKNFKNAPLIDDKTSTIFNMETNYLLICGYSCLKRIVEEVDIYDLEQWLDNKNYDSLNNLSKKMNHSFAIAAIHSVDEDFDFCGSGIYIIPKNSITEFI